MGHVGGSGSGPPPGQVVCNQVPKGGANTAGNPINVGHNSKIESRDDVSIGFVGGLDFGVQRFYTSGRMIHFTVTGFYPLLGMGWHCNLDCRLFMEEGTSDIIALLPDADQRIFAWNEGLQKWESEVGQNFVAEITSTGGSEPVYTMRFPQGGELDFDQVGYLVAVRNALGVTATVQRETVEYQGASISRATAVNGPAVDGRWLQLTYNSQNPWLLESVTLKNSGDSGYSQTLVNYQYNGDHFLIRAKYLGEDRGEYYKYGSWSQQNGVQPVGIINRTLAEAGSLLPGGVESPVSTYAYRAGGMGESGWSDYEPQVEWQAVYKDPNDPTLRTGFEKIFVITDGTGNYGPVEDSTVMRMYRPTATGDYNGAYTTYYSTDGYRYQFQSLNSTGYENTNHFKTFDDYRRVKKLYAPGEKDSDQNPHWMELTYQDTGGSHQGFSNVVDMKDYHNRHTTTVYDSTFNLPTQVTDPYGRNTVYVYNGYGQLTDVTFFKRGNNPSQNQPDWTESYDYNAYHQLETYTDRLGRATTYTYYSSGQGRLYQVQQPSGSVSTYTYYSSGLTQAVTRNDGPTVSYTYEADRVKTATVGSYTTTYNYDSRGRLQSVVDPKTWTTTYAYDGADRLVKVTDPENGVSKYEYDNYGNLTKFTDPEDRSTTYTYDDLNRVQQETDALSRTKTYTYGSSGCSNCGIQGQVTKVIDFAGHITSFDYDEYGRLTTTEYFSSESSYPNNPARTLTHQHNFSVGGVPTDLVTSISDTALTLSGTSYAFTYDDDLRLKSTTHPEGYAEEYGYDAYDRPLWRRDVDAGVTEYAYVTSGSSKGQVLSIQNPFGQSTQFAYNETSGPRGAIKTVTLANNTTANYTYDSYGRIDVLSNKTSAQVVMTSFDYTYDANGNITRVDLPSPYDYLHYEYDKLNRLTYESRYSAADDERWHRAYEYDHAGNRTQMDFWYTGAQTETTTYEYNGLNQLTLSTIGYVDTAYSYDNNGNLTVKDPDGSSNNTNDSWTLDNRLSEVADESSGLTTQYACDYQGARILRRDNDGTRTRYFFQGLTEEVVQESVAGASSDTAFAFAEKEDGESASEWAVIYPYPSGATITAVTDTDHHPDGVKKVIKCHGGNGNVFGIGDNDAEGWNPNGTAWNCTKRVLSFWYKGGFGPLYIGLTTSAGSKELHYYATAGTDYVDGSGNVNVYLGTSAAGTWWMRFERNIEADWERVATSQWQNIDGVAIKPTSVLNYDFYIDDIRLSDSQTVKFNSLTGGAIGQIASVREVTGTGGDGSTGLSDTWLHYDHIGNVMNTSTSSGALGTTYDQDAWGNVLASATTGQWASTFSVRHLTTKEHDPDAELYYFYGRMYQCGIGRFISIDPILKWVRLQHGDSSLSDYVYCSNNPNTTTDPSGMDSVDMGGDMERLCKCQQLADTMKGLVQTDRDRDCVDRCRGACSTQAETGYVGAYMMGCFNACQKDKDCAEELGRFNLCVLKAIRYIHNPVELAKKLKDCALDVTKKCRKLSGAGDYLNPVPQAN